MSKNKIAITTWFHYYNYGTALQAVALSETLKSLDHDPDVVNYLPSGRRHSKRKATEWSKSKRLNDRIKNEKFEKFVRKNLSFTAPCINDEDFYALNNQYEAFISGSDQIWSPVFFDPRYFLDYVSNNRKKISYAPSFGVTKIETDWVGYKMGNLISQFSHLSARETSGVKLISSLTGRNVDEVLDPTLLLNYAEWRKVIKKDDALHKERFLLCYFLGDNSQQWLHAKKIASQYNLSVKIVPTYEKDIRQGDISLGIGPEDFFNLIDDSEIVITDSFHAALFSIICEKPFFIVERFHSQDPNSQNSRVHHLIKLINHSELLIRHNERLRLSYSSNVNYDSIRKTIDERRSFSVKYLKKCLTVKTAKVSVIVPAYNVEDYIKHCLNSISSQSYTNLEILVINDGSLDNSGVIADQCAKIDQRIRVFHKKNEGVSAARNTGLDVMTGDYVVFVDSDDIIAPNHIEYLLGIMESVDVNIGASQNCHNEYTKNLNIGSTDDRIEIWSPKKAIEGIYAWFYPLACFNKIFKSTFIRDNNLRFLPNLSYAEGMTFNIMALQNSGPIAVGKKQLYHQTFNPYSATRSLNIQGWRDCFYAYEYQRNHSAYHSKSIENARNFHIWHTSLVIACQIYKQGKVKHHPKEFNHYISFVRKGYKSVFKAKIPLNRKIYLTLGIVFPKLIIKRLARK